MPMVRRGNTRKILIRILDTVGDGSGTKNANGDYSLTATKFLIKPAANEKFVLSRMIGHIVDGGVFDSGYYGNGIILTNGISVTYKRNGKDIDLLDGQKVMTNVDWAGICFDVERHSFGSGVEYLDFRWTFAKSGTSILLDGKKGDELSITFNDNLTGLIGHYFTVQGYVKAE